MTSIKAFCKPWFFRFLSSLKVFWEQGFVQLRVETYFLAAQSKVTQQLGLELKRQVMVG